MWWGRTPVAYRRGMSGTPGGQVALAPTGWTARAQVGFIGIVPAFFVAQGVFGIVRVWFDDADFALQIAAALAAAIAVIALAVVVNARRFPIPVADFSAGRLLVGDGSIAFSEIDEARYLPTAVKWGRARGILRIGRRKTEQSTAIVAAIPLPFPEDRPGDALRQAALLVVLDASRIELPADPYDPTGRFSRMGSSTGHLDKQSALAVVEDPHWEPLS
ncbi:MAG: hypothetical protein RI885_2489 [Actinomycetota bacterium]|jgi:hypothetical protein